LDVFKSAFSADFLSTVDEIGFCGDIGDPVYAKDLLPIVEYIKQSSHTVITIITNGSYKDTVWWQQLGSLLTERDFVVFSVDGWDQVSNQQYRVNSDFDSIIAGARALRANSDCTMIWSTIYFKFNELDINKIRSLAKDMGFDIFKTVRSSKFDNRYAVNGVDQLKPVNSEFVATTTQYQSTIEHLSSRPRYPTKNYQSDSAHAWARCLRWHKEIFVNVEGMVFPCAWFNNAYMQNSFVVKHKDQININTRSLLDILQDPLWEELYLGFDNNPLEICQMKCKNAQ
jgi:MoaA/NifB/PqqE/SkfB family radical SAM enzyme